MTAQTGQTGHTWRAGRRIAAQEPTHFLVDERSEADLIAFAVRMAASLKFDEGNGAADETAFRSLLENDITVLLAEISLTDPSAEYSLKSSGEGEDLSTANRESIELLQKWHDRLSVSGAGLVPNPVAADLFKRLVALLGQEFRGLLPIDASTPSVFDLPDLAGQVEGVNAQRAPRMYSALKRVQQAMTEAARRHLEKVLSGRADHPAHIGLYLAFVRLMRTAQSHLNSLTERHLDYFYRDYLGLSPRPAKQDRAHVWFALPPGAPPQRLPKGTRLGAGLTPDGRAIEFETTDDMIVTSARIAKLRALRVEHTMRGVALSIREADGLEALAERATESGAADLGWRPFGPWEEDSAVPVRDTELGLLVSAPILALEGGEREVTIRLRIDNPSMLRELRQIQDPNLFRQAVTVAGGYMDVRGGLHVCDSYIECSFKLPANAPPVAAFPGSGLACPAWRLLLSNDWRDYAYSRLQGLELHDVDIQVSVRGMRSVSVRNPEGPVDTSKPFTPFGGMPVRGSALTIASPEWQGRTLTRLYIEADWANLQDDLGAYFGGYGTGVQTADFRASLLQLQDNQWQAVETYPKPSRLEGVQFPLFVPRRLAGGGAAANEDPGGKDAARFVRPNAAYTFQFLDEDPQRAANEYRFNRAGAGQPPTSAQAAVFRLTLEGPPMAFGHALYPELIANASLRQALALSRGPLSKLTDTVTKTAKAAAAAVAKKIGADAGAIDAKPPPLNPPFAPMVKDFRVGYDARTTLNLGAVAPRGEVFRIDSFGHRRQITAKSALVEDLSDDGYLYLGLANIDAASLHPVSVLFQIDGRTSETWTGAGTDRAAAIKWSYRSRTGWERFPPDGVPLDETRGLIKSGIVKFMPQRGMAADANGDGLVWFRASTTADAAKAGSIVSIETQGVAAVRSSPAEEINGRWTLPAGSIKHLNAKDIQIASIHQPFETQGGEPPESTADFRLRVSERLRHRNRAVQAKDYEQLTLGRFPVVGDAKCLTGPDGRVLLTVAPVRHGRNRMPALPAGTLTDIHDYLSALMPASAGELVVRSPNYDRVRVSAWIDAGDRELDALLHDLEVAADKVIAPWLFDPTAPLRIGPGESRVDVSHIQQALADVDQVRAVSAVSLVTFTVADRFGGQEGRMYSLRDTAAVRDERAASHAEIAASSEWSVLTPALQHRFRILTTPRVGEAALRQDFRLAPTLESEDDRAIRRLAGYERAGIGNLSVGSELVICRDPWEVTGRRPAYRVRRP